MNRLYWLDADGLWSLIHEREAEVLINTKADALLWRPVDYKNEGYSLISINTGRYWYWHYRADTRLCRSMVKESEVPKPIRLLEMFYE